MPAHLATYETTPKLTVLFLGLALLLWKPAIQEYWRTRLGRTFGWLLLATAASLLISSLVSKDIWLSLSGTIWRRLGAIDQIAVLGVAALIGSFVYLHRAGAKLLMLAMESAAALASVYGILQFIHFDPLIPAGVYTIGTPVAVLRPPATLTQATFFATFLLPAIVLAAALRLRANSAVWNRFHETVLALCTAALILTGTRAALLGLTAGLCILLCLERRRLSRHVIWVTVVLALTAGALLVSPAGKGVRARMAEWASDPAGGPRLLVWRDSLTLLSHHVVAGIGPEQFEGEFREVESVDLARKYPDHYHESPHNFFLEAALAQGAPGLVIWLGLLGLAGYCAFLCWRRSEPDGAALSAALIAMMVSSQFCPLILTNELYLLASIATLVAVASPAQEMNRARRNSAPYLILSARIASLVFAFFASAYIAQATLYSETKTSIAQADVAGAEQWYQLAREFPMPGPNLDIARQAAAAAPHLPPELHTEAKSLAQLAAETAEQGNAERFNALYMTGSLDIASGDLQQAETKLRAAVDVSPAWYRSRMALACVLWWEGKDQEAQQQGDIALTNAGVKRSFVQTTLNGARAQASLRARYGFR